MAETIALAEVLFAVRQELLKANSAALRADEAVMEFEECEVEFAVEVEKKGRAGVAIHFLTLGGSLKKSEQNTVRIKFKGFEGRPIVAKAGGRGAGPALARQTKKASGPKGK